MSSISVSFTYGVKLQHWNRWNIDIVGVIWVDVETPANESERGKNAIEKKTSLYRLLQKPSIIMILSTGDR